MRFFKYFSQSKLFANFLLTRNYNNFARIVPVKYYSIKTIKQYYYENKEKVLAQQREYQDKKTLFEKARIKMLYYFFLGKIQT